MLTLSWTLNFNSSGPRHYFQHSCYIFSKADDPGSWILHSVLCTLNWPQVVKVFWETVLYEMRFLGLLGTNFGLVTACPMSSLKNGFLRTLKIHSRIYCPLPQKGKDWNSHWTMFVQWRLHYLIQKFVNIFYLAAYGRIITSKTSYCIHVIVRDQKDIRGSKTQRHLTKRQ